MKLYFTIGKRIVNFVLSVSKPQNQYIGGITNKCMDGRYVLFIDYDGVPVSWVREELTFLSDKYNLSNIYVFKTNNGHHAVCTMKFNLNKLLTILEDTSTDAAYISVPLRRARKVWTLRQTAKDGISPKFVFTIEGFNNVSEQSKAHNIYLETFYNIKTDSLNDDGNVQIMKAEYFVNGV